MRLHTPLQLKLPCNVISTHCWAPFHPSMLFVVAPCLPSCPVLSRVSPRYENTERRKTKVEAKGLRYMGMGVSGGEEGARRGETCTAAPAAHVHSKAVGPPALDS